MVKFRSALECINVIVDAIEIGKLQNHINSILKIKTQTIAQTQVKEFGEDKIHFKFGQNSGTPCTVRTSNQRRYHEYNLARTFVYGFENAFRWIQFGHDFHVNS